ncbi:putative ubiquitin-protein ligase (Asi3) [Aspergillus affinis]|uniref:putative ubiquitin-protein ligase (Asi3) n=1 Tax=Aspergillus affinis TaxID=1070780 RepID=UPI0022FE59CB|nr:uncharacterized protein KD926_009298 [Aspergillus affinis]KAI9039573.1 hypothetical protein KD926_009298 [Aspergillus affinis]
MSALQGPESILNSPAATTAAAQSLKNTTTITTSVLSPRDLLALPFRGLYQAEHFAFSTLPRRLGRLVGLQQMATLFGGGGAGAAPAGDVAAATAQAANVAREGVAEAVGQADTGSHFADILQALIRFSGFFSYLTSRWSLACFTTSPDYSLLRYGSPGKRLLFDFGGGGGFLHSLGSTLLPWETDEQSCSAVRMSRPTSASDFSHGSFGLLWPVFLRLCLNHFVDTLSCALQGRAVVTESGMSIFEHSLAFAEAESTITQSLGLGLFGLPKQSASKGDSGDGSQSAAQILSRAQVLERMNVTPELLLIALISCCNSLTSNVLDILGKQNRYRFFNTAFWGLCFMSTMAWGLLNSLAAAPDGVVVKFPTVCIVGFIPHLALFIGTIICGVIYSIALAITSFSLPVGDSPRPSLRQRFAVAHENMQGASQIQNLRFNRHEDFYTALLRTGYTAMFAASEAVFLNEGQGVVAREMTWLEEDRLAEIESSRRRHRPRESWATEAQGAPFEGADTMNFDSLQAPPPEWESGYGREKKIEKPRNGSRSVRSRTDAGGVGVLRGAIRWYHGFSFFRGIFYLLLGWLARGLDKLLNKFGIAARPQWLAKLIGPRRKGVQERETGGKVESYDFWILTEDGELELPGDHEFDVEREMRKRERSNTADWKPTDEGRLDETLYSWWKAGGSWGNQDHSADYVPSVEDVDDTTSVVSMSTVADSEWEDESDGRRTPTLAEPFPPGFSRESTPAQESLMDVSSFARLLDPRDQESRQEARILAAHLSAGQEGRVLTRRRFREQVERERAQILISSRTSHLVAQTSSNEKRRPTPEEESDILEKLILSRRSQAAPVDGQTWESGASGLGPSGPPCVVCRMNSRSIITWPCRCLCVCEECRVNLAMNNYGSCVTCRQEVGGFVRLWVP